MDLSKLQILFFCSISICYSQVVTFITDNYFLSFQGTKGAVYCYDNQLNLKSMVSISGVSNFSYIQFNAINYYGYHNIFVFQAYQAFLIAIDPKNLSIVSVFTLSAYSQSRQWSWPFISFSVPGTSISSIISQLTWQTNNLQALYNKSDIGFSPFSNQFYIYQIVNCQNSSAPTTLVYQYNYGNTYTCNSDTININGNFAYSSDINCMITIKNGLCYRCQSGYSPDTNLDSNLGSCVIPPSTTTVTYTFNLVTITDSAITTDSIISTVTDSITSTVTNNPYSTSITISKTSTSNPSISTVTQTIIATTTIDKLFTATRTVFTQPTITSITTVSSTSTVSVTSNSDNISGLKGLEIASVSISVIILID